MGAMTGTTIPTRSATAAALLQALSPYRGKGGRERSVKLRRHGLDADRFLLSFHRSAFGPDPLKTVAGIAADLAFPDDAAAWLAEAFEGADIVHLGFEAGGGEALYKLYLEYAGAYRAGALAAYRDGLPILVHRAIKWAPGSIARALSRYQAMPCQTASELEQALASFGDGVAQRLAHSLLALALARVPAEALLLMQVDEPGNPRRSFDLNLYPANIGLDDIAAELAGLSVEFGLSETDLRGLRATIGGGTIGHLSGGIGRDGAPFLTLYYGIETFC